MKTLNDFLQQYYNNIQLQHVDDNELHKRIDNHVSRYLVNVPLASSSNTEVYESLGISRYKAVNVIKMLSCDRYKKCIEYLQQNPSHIISDNKHHHHFFDKNWLVFEVSAEEIEADKKKIAEWVAETYKLEIEQANADLLADENTALAYAKAELEKYERHLAISNRPNLDSFKQMTVAKHELESLLNDVDSFSFQDIKDKCSVKDNSILVAQIENMGYIKTKQGSKNVRSRGENDY